MENATRSTKRTFQDVLLKLLRTTYVVLFEHLDSNTILGLRTYYRINYRLVRRRRSSIPNYTGNGQVSHPGNSESKSAMGFLII
jgi:hypothetical protein